MEAELEPKNYYLWAANASARNIVTPVDLTLELLNVRRVLKRAFVVKRDPNNHEVALVTRRNGKLVGWVAMGSDGYRRTRIAVCDESETRLLLSVAEQNCQGDAALLRQIHHVGNSPKKSHKPREKNSPAQVARGSLF